MSECPFCDIVNREVPADIVHEDSTLIAFRDINPQAPTHILVIPREHIASAHAVTPAQDAMWSKLLHAAQRLAESDGIADAGYRLVTNTGRKGGQTVDHLHLHLLGGRQMTWPPG
jgi:histidine triad (HIT) family protein